MWPFPGTNVSNPYPYANGASEIVYLPVAGSFLGPMRSPQPVSWSDALHCAHMVMVAAAAGGRVGRAYRMMSGTWSRFGVRLPGGIVCGAGVGTEDTGRGIATLAPGAGEMKVTGAMADTLKV